MDATAVVALALLAWLILPLPVAVACGRAFDRGSRPDERASLDEAAAAVSEPPRAA